MLRAAPHCNIWYRASLDMNCVIDGALSPASAGLRPIVRLCLNNIDVRVMLGAFKEGAPSANAAHAARCCGMGVEDFREAVCRDRPEALEELCASHEGMYFSVLCAVVALADRDLVSERARAAFLDCAWRRLRKHAAGHE